MKLVLEKRDFVPYHEKEISIRNDVIFRMVFGTNENVKFLREFLESILHQKITNIVIKNDIALDKTHSDNKLMRLDILAEIDKKFYIDVELQHRNEYNIIERGDAYASGVLFNSLKVGQDYLKVHKTIVIWLLSFNKYKDGPYHEVGHFVRKSNKEPLNNNIEYHFFQLPRFFEEVKEIKTPEQQWLAYLSHQLNKEELEALFKMNRSIEEINKIVDIVMSDEDVSNELMYRVLDKNLEDLKKKKAYEDGEEDGIKKGTKIGIETGKKENSIDIARKMKLAGKPIEEIIEFTNLTKEEIEKL